MYSSTEIGFHQYRYQILPLYQQLQLSLLSDEFRTLDDLKRKKNTLFQEVLSGVKSIAYRRPIVHRILFSDGKITIIKLAIKRNIKIEKKDFTIEEAENWPSVILIFNNDPHVQKCFVQSRSAFQFTSTIINIIEENLNKELARLQLSVAFEPIYQKNFFWEVIEKYKGRITQIDFELISPNMSNISESIGIDLGALHRNTNTARTNLQLNSDPKSCLSVTEEDETINSFVDYSSKGGGSITVKVKGLKRKVSTAQGIDETHIDEAYIKGNYREVKEVIENLG